MKPSHPFNRSAILQWVGLIAFLLLPATAFGQSNLLTNPGFESGLMTGWGSSYGNYSVVAGNAHSGTYAAQVGYSSAVAQTVTGLKPNTNYTCTGWLKSSVAGEVVYLGAENFGGQAVSRWTSSATYTQLSMTFTTGASSTSAEIFVYASGADASFCDDLSLTISGGAPPAAAPVTTRATPLVSGSALLINPGFETGDLTGWTAGSGTYSVITSSSGPVHSGTYAAKINAGSTVAQTVTGLSPNTTYTCTGWLNAATAGQTVYLGAQGFGGTTVSKGISAAAYTQVTITFTTGPSSTSATIFVYNDFNITTVGSAADPSYCDDLNLSVGPPNLLANPGFETGTIAGWGSSYGSYSVVTGVANTGTYAGEVNYGSGIAQTVTGLTPNTSYTCTGYLKVTTAGQDVYLIAQNFGGTSVNKLANTTSYVQLTLNFTTGPTNTSAEIVVYEAGANPAFCDDLSLTANGGAGKGDTTGTVAMRIADCLQRLGINTFSKLDYKGYVWSWGGSQGSYDSATTGRAINYITGGSGLTVYDREYHHDANGSSQITPYQMTWIHQVYMETGSPFSIAIGSNGSSSDIPGMVSLVQDSVSNGLNYAKWVEGINEPNTDFGSGTIPASTAATVQSSLYSQIHAVTSAVPVAAPSVVFGLPDPEAYLTSYLGSSQASIVSNSDVSNIHLYPPYSPNGTYSGSTDGTMSDVNAAFDSVFSGLPAINTEYHPTLYSSIQKNNHTYDAYWGPIYLLSSYVDYNWQAAFWFALFDYNSSSMPCGLFATSDANPRAAATAFRALFQLTGDTGTNKSTFTPGKLNVTVTGLPAAPAGAPQAGGRWALFENSNNQYFLMIWNEQNTISTTTTPVTVTFNSHSMTKVVDYNITSGSQTPLQTLNSVSSMTVNLETSLHLLQITY